MNFFQSLLVNFLLFIRHTEVDGGCILSPDRADFGTPSPVYLRNGVYLEPDARNGKIELQRSDTITLACPGKGNYLIYDNYTKAYDVLEAHCITDQTFRIERWIGEFKNVKCKTQPWVTSEETSATCYGGSKIYRVGYKVKDYFYKLYESCFDKTLLLTHYVEYYMTPERMFSQRKFRRPQFIDGGHFGKVRMSALYKLDNQKNRLDVTLGKSTSNLFLTKNQFLTRGHLAASADFCMHAQSRATFQYINTGPQWLKGNAGDWAALEDSLRRRINTLGVNATVYTGTHGTMVLPDKNGALKEIYLDTDANNNGIVPVPLYFYKVVYDPMQQKASAFISINSSFYNQTLTDELTFCNDICDGNKNFSWLKWRANDGTFSFCCDYNEFSRTVDYLPIHTVKGTFY
ncbi:hypothetical protein K1T71_014411 [Dendrolimus kikuchii]|uniref:Uncharacterized protein n=1 Tax=Dendrolimus kikuchii TaxID=765133 RepID=A0ACC1CDX0_9NEOP|nr:hypothetical protein K1T71_014411 [Dendrolimus kikuchii]